MNILKSPVVSLKDSLLSASLWQPAHPHHSPPTPPGYCYSTARGSRDKLLLATITTDSEGPPPALEKFPICSSLVISKLGLVYSWLLSYSLEENISVHDQKKKKNEFQILLDNKQRCISEIQRDQLKIKKGERAYILYFSFSCPWSRVVCPVFGKVLQTLQMLSDLKQVIVYSWVLIASHEEQEMKFFLLWK